MYKELDMKLIYRNVYGETSKNVKALLPNNNEHIKKDNNYLDILTNTLDFFSKIIDFISNINL